MPPFLRQVEDAKLEALILRLESISKLSADFLVLLSGSTLIATLGLFQNSPAVIIGAMIIAPLMRPLVGLSLATLTGDSRLLGRAVLTLVAGTFLGVVISAALALLFSSLELTPEILGRTHPTLLDLGVAIFAGAVGAYCQTNEKLSDTLAGVAISVALVPPLSVVGIGLAFGSMSVWSGAALLYATNLIGITVAGSLVFLVMGFIPLHQAKKGLTVSAIVSLLLVIPLALSMRELVLENQITIKTKSILKEKTVTFRGVQLREVRVERFKEPMIVTATVLSPEQPITPHQVLLVQEFLIRELNMPVEFRLQIIPAMQVTAAGSDGVTEPHQEPAPTQPAQNDGLVNQSTVSPGEVHDNLPEAHPLNSQSNQNPQEPQSQASPAEKPQTEKPVNQKEESARDSETTPEQPKQSTE
jgi:uncharacterized hydrophobic protein (TIGR00271 family)